MTSPAVTTEAQAIKIAREFLDETLNGSDLSVIQVRHYGRRDVEEWSVAVKQTFKDCGIDDDEAVREHLAQSGKDREHWAVAFRAEDPAGNATTIHATTVLVFDDTGEAVLAAS